MKRTITLLVGLALSSIAFAAPVAADDEHSNRCHDRFGPSSQSGPNIIYGSLVGDRLIGTRCDDIIIGFRGDDLIVGLAGNDILWGFGGNDHLRGVDGEEDALRGGAGRDRCVGDQFDTFARCERVRVIEVLVP